MYGLDSEKVQLTVGQLSVGHSNWTVLLQRLGPRQKQPCKAAFVRTRLHGVKSQGCERNI